MKTLFKLILVLLLMFSSYIVGFAVANRTENYNEYEFVCAVKTNFGIDREFRFNFVHIFRNEPDFSANLNTLQQLQNDACAYHLVKGHFPRVW